MVLVLLGSGIDPTLGSQQSGETTPARIVGRIVAPDGTPAEGAIVASSAGGRAVTDAQGSFLFDVAVPLDAESIQLTARAGARGQSSTGSLQVPIAASGPTQAGTLALVLGGCCVPGWVPTFGELPGVIGGQVTALATFDDGDGPALFVGGAFTGAGGAQASRIARCDGARWSALGTGLNNDVRALAVFDDGNGPDLYVGGSFTSAGGVPANRVARWDGSSWSALGSGTNATVETLVVYDDGNGPDLYAGGSFTSAGGSGASRIARWNGTSWSALGSGLNQFVAELVVYDDGNGPDLYACGSFTSAGGVSASQIARWSGASWSALGTGLTGGSVSALGVFDGGGGPALFAGGLFTTAGGVPANGIARWDGTSWSAVGGGVAGPGGIKSLLAFDDGSGPALFAGGSFTSAGGVAAERIARWNGSSWADVGGGASGGGTVEALAVFDDGPGPPVLAAGGFFSAVGGVPGFNLSTWDGSGWRGLGEAPNWPPYALASFDDGGGPRLYVGGGFTHVGGLEVNRIAAWDGASWTPLGAGMNNNVHALSGFDDGGGARLYAGGRFTIAGGNAALHIAVWDGTSWTQPGGGLIGLVNSLATFDDGSGLKLYAGGNLDTGGPAEGFVASWDGSSWSSLVPPSGPVYALLVWDDGSGPRLYAAGYDVTSSFPGCVERWDGAYWTNVGFMDKPVQAIAAFDDGTGSALYAGGSFTYANLVTAGGLARWNGTSWTAVGGGTNGPVWALRGFDDGGGGGPALYAGGDFTSAGGVSTSRIARWNGSSWSALGAGMGDPAINGGTVVNFEVFDHGTGPGLIACGQFKSALDSHDSFLARWGCFEEPPVIDCPTELIVLDRKNGPPGETVAYSVTATDSCDPAPTVVCVPPSGSFFPRGTTVVTCTATDSAGQQSTRTFPVVVRPRVRAR